MNQYRARLFFIAMLLMVGTAVIIVRLFTIQILDSQRYAIRSRDQTSSD
jgi:cell division protein FtsI/penicillin-binding protein 2